MKFSDFMVRQACRTNLASRDRDGVLRELVSALAAAGAVPKSAVDDLVAALIKREKNGSTGFGKGVAVPHVKHAKIKKMVGAVGRSVEGIDFAALDHQPVHLVVLLLSPENQPEQHLQAMNVIFTSLQDDTFRRFMRQANTDRELIELLDEADASR